MKNTERRYNNKFPLYEGEEPFPERAVFLSPKILFIDIETSPNLSYIWGHYEQNALLVEDYWHILSFSVKWLGKKTYVYGLPDYPSYKHDKTTDKRLVQDIWKYLDEADIVVGHNVDAFDIKKINARFAFWGMKPPKPYKTVDTLKIAKKHFAFHANKLADLVLFLKLGEKIHTGGFELWKRCMFGDLKAWKKMKQYNKNDVVILEKLYLHLLPWISNHPNYGLYREQAVCPKCGSDNIQYRGFAMNSMTKYRRFQCMKCGGWGISPINQQVTKPLKNLS